MLLQLLKSLCCTTRAQKGTSDDHVALTLLHVCEAVLQHEDLITVATFNADLVNYVVQISIYFFRHEWRFTLATLAASLGQPLLYTVLMEDLLATVALDRSERNAKADWTNKWIDESAVVLFHVFFAKAIGFLKHELDQVAVDSLNKLLSLCHVIIF